MFKNSIGVLASEDFMSQLAELLRAQLTPTDICGRFGGNGFLVLLERGTARDVETWAENVVKRVNQHVFAVEDKTISATVTVGLGLLPAANVDVSAAVTDAVNATRRGRELGGNQMYAVDKSDTDTRVQAYDKIWVKHIKSALMENRFPGSCSSRSRVCSARTRACSTCWCACWTNKARRSFRRSSSRPPSAMT